MDYKKAELLYEGIAEDDIGWLPLEFDALRPNPMYDGKFGGDRSKWPIVKPEHGPPIPPLDGTIRKMIDATWKFAEPKQGAGRASNAFIGTRGVPQPFGPRQPYQPAVRPSNLGLQAKQGSNTAIASDWNVFNTIERVNAVTFRGDTRSPHQVIVKSKGFSPPNTRTDRYYLENSVYAGFVSYMKRRLGRDISKEDFLHAVNEVAGTREAQQLLCDYTVWRGLMSREEAHLGRMVDHELLKGYISTSIAVDTSAEFATRFLKEPGWLYVVVVHGGFVVPLSLKREELWGTPEAEIAQLGPIPSDRIVGFRRIDRPTGRFFALVGPIFIRTTFRKREPKACAIMFDFMSGKKP